MLILSMALALAMDPVLTSVEHYDRVESYRVTLRSKSGNSSETIKYYFKRPGFVRMEFVNPHKGAILVYDPKKGAVRLRPFGFLKPFILTLSPDSGLVKSSKGHRVDESDIGSLLKTVLKLQQKGTPETAGDDSVGGRPAVVVEVEGKDGFTVEGIHRYVIWLDKRLRLPLKVQAYDIKNSLMEEVLMDDLEINVELPEDFFAL